MFLPLSAEHVVFPSVASNTPNCKSGCYKNVGGELGLTLREGVVCGSLETAY